MFNNPGSWSKLGVNSGSGSKFNVFGSTTLLHVQYTNYNCNYNKMQTVSNLILDNSFCQIWCLFTKKFMVIFPGALRKLLMQKRYKRILYTLLNIKTASAENTFQHFILLKYQEHIIFKHSRAVSDRRFFFFSYTYVCFRVGFKMCCFCAFRRVQGAVAIFTFDSLSLVRCYFENHIFEDSQKVALNKYRYGTTYFWSFLKFIKF